MDPIVGLHHVTAIVADAQRTLDFYTHHLGLRFVKRTINFDDPGSYHLYFGDDAGSPGTILTFFAWPGATRGHQGAGETSAVAFSVPLASIDFWENRLRSAGIVVERAGPRFEEQVLRFADADGMKLEIVGDADAGTATASRDADIAGDHAIRGFFGVTLEVSDLPATGAILATMGFEQVAQEGSRYRFAAGGKAPGRRIDVVVRQQLGRGRMGAGTVHHIAFRTSDEASQLEWRQALGGQVEVTQVLDRTYFHSIYFREPGGVLFELATDPPGFTFDEPIETLGQELKLPPWLEGRRSVIAEHLPPLQSGAVAVLREGSAS